MCPVEAIHTVRITDDCIVCDRCQSICPAVFEIRDGSCGIRAIGNDPSSLNAYRPAVMDAAKQCPVQAILVTFSSLPPADTLDQAGTDPLPGRQDQHVDGHDRRRFLTVGCAGVVALVGTMAVGLLGLSRFMLHAGAGKGRSRVRAGDWDAFTRLPAGSVDERHKADGFWMVRLEDRLVALDTRCTHLGCVLNHHEAGACFRCPCHGSGFTLAGLREFGPAPRAMERLGIERKGPDVIVDRGRRFLNERAQWSQPGSFLRVE